MNNFLLIMRLTLFCLMVCVSGFTIEAYATVQKHSSDYAIMENDKIRVSIDTCNSSSTFGMITSLYNKKRCATIGNNRLFSLRTGNLTAYEKPCCIVQTIRSLLNLENSEQKILLHLWNTPFHQMVFS